MDLDKFPCSSCGACCKSVKGLMPTKKGTTECIHLIDNQCSIYEDRPLLCRIDEGFEKLSKHFANKKEYYKENAKKCNELIELHKIDSKYKIIIEE